jgi:hypothetical protein
MKVPGIASLAAALLVSACATTVGAARQDRTAAAIRYDPPIPSDEWQWMAKISAEYRSDNSLVADIKNCYYENGVGSTAWLYKYKGLRTCLYLDYTGYKANQVSTANFRAPGEPFFSKSQARNRWKFFGPKAGYASRNEMLHSMDEAYQVIKPMLVNVVPRYASSTTFVAPPGPAHTLPHVSGLPPATVLGETGP